MYIKLKSNNNLIGSGAVGWPRVSYFARSGASALFGGRLGIVWRSSWAGTLADFGVGLTQVEGRIIDKVLNKKFVTRPCNEVGLTPSFVGEVVGMVGDCFSFGVGAWGRGGCGV